MVGFVNQLFVQWTTKPTNWFKAHQPSEANVGWTVVDNDRRCSGGGAPSLQPHLLALLKLSTNLPRAAPSRETPELDETFSIRQNFVLKFPSRLLREHQLSRKRSA